MDRHSKVYKEVIHTYGIKKKNHLLHKHNIEVIFNISQCAQLILTLSNIINIARNGYNTMVNLRSQFNGKRTANSYH